MHATTYFRYQLEWLRLGTFSHELLGDRSKKVKKSLK